MRKILLTIFSFALVCSLCGCNPPEKKEDTTTKAATTTTTAVTTTESATTVTSETVSETTTGRVGGFIVKEEAPGADIEWEDIGTIE